MKPGEEKEFLHDRSVRELSGIAAKTGNVPCGIGGADVWACSEAAIHITAAEVRCIWGQQLWLFANGLWNEPLLLEVKDRTTISSNTTLPYDEPDQGAALTFALSEATRLTGQLRREQLQLRELSLAIRFEDFTEVGGAHRFGHPQYRNSVVNAALEGIFHDIMAGQFRASAANPDRDGQPVTAGHAANVVGTHG